METLLKGLKLYIRDKKATKSEIKIFLEFIQKLKSSRRIRFIYRGDSNILDYYKIDAKDISLLNEYIFILGCKGMSFLENKIVKKNIFHLIWDKFHNKVCKSNFSSDNTQNQIHKFLVHNPEIKDYFSNNLNKQNFESISQSLKDCSKSVADYYLAILHTIGKSGIGKSYFLSSSKDYLIANKFKGENNIILFGWLPRKGIQDNIISYEDIGKQNKYIKSLKLPTYQIPVYPCQKEICLKCGMLPHYIVGFQYCNRFYINPNTLNSWNNDIIYNGLDINQSRFQELFIKTKYNNSFIFCEGKYYSINNVVEL